MVHAGFGVESGRSGAPAFRVARTEFLSRLRPGVRRATSTTRRAMAEAPSRPLASLAAPLATVSSCAVPSTPTTSSVAAMITSTIV